GEAEEHVGARGLQAGGERREIALGAGGRGALAIGGERRRHLALDPLLVHAAGVEVAGPALGRRALRPVGARRLEDLPQRRAIALAELVDPSPRALVGGDGFLLHPAPADVLIEVVAGRDAGVEPPAAGGG